MDVITRVNLATLFHVECFEHRHRDTGHKCPSPLACPRGIAFGAHAHQLKWAEDGHNLVVTVGLNKVLDATFVTGLTTPAWYVGLVDNASFTAYAAGDTMASHAGWVEGTPYSDATRQAFTPGSISGGSVSNSAAKAVFAINATLTIRGLFLVDNSTKGGSTGTLYGAGDIATPRAVLSGDTFNAQVTLTSTAV